MAHLSAQTREGSIVKVVRSRIEKPLVIRRTAARESEIALGLAMSVIVVIAMLVGFEWPATGLLDTFLQGFTMDVPGRNDAYQANIMTYVWFILLLPILLLLSTE